MKLSQWAKKNGLSYQTAFNLFKKGQLPGKVTQLASGTILIEDNSTIVNSKDISTEIIKIIYHLVDFSSDKKVSKEKLEAIKTILEENND